LQQLVTRQRRRGCQHSLCSESDAGILF
jgi:hypothetical protein